MEKKLQKLFDYQKFAGNAKLQKVIDSVSARNEARRLSLRLTDAAIEQIAAAGEPYFDAENKTDKKKE